MPEGEKNSWAARDEGAVSPSHLREIALFGALSDEILHYLCGTLKVCHIGVGETVFREGDSAKHVYIVLEGEMEVLRKSKQGRDQRIAILGPGDVFGEMSVIDIQRRSATIRALAPSRLLSMSTEDMDALYRHDLKSYTLVILNIARDLSRRLRMTDGILADFTANILDEYLGRAHRP